MLTVNKIIFNYHSNMATHPRSDVSAGDEVGVQILTKDEKEALLSQKMDMIRQKNKALAERHKLIEVDKKQAEEAGQAVKPSIDSQILPAEDAPKYYGRGRGYLHNRDGGRQTREKPKFARDSKDPSHNQPIFDKSHHPPVFDTSHVQNKKNTDYIGPRDSNATRNTAKNKRNIRTKEEFIQSEGMTNVSSSEGLTYKGRLRDNEGPPPDPVFNPLADRRWSDVKVDSREHRRHPRNYGGADPSRVMKNMRQREKERHYPNKPIEIAMSGRERKNHEAWKAERERYDMERIQRQMNDAGTWRRAWDADKMIQENEVQDMPQNFARTQPMTRPGGLQQFVHPQEHQQHHHEDHKQPQPLPVSQQPPENKTPRGRGRGRGILAKLGQLQQISPGKPEELSPSNRSISEQKNDGSQQNKALLVTFNNTASDSTVKVEYDKTAGFHVPQTTCTLTSQNVATPKQSAKDLSTDIISKQKFSGNKGYHQKSKTPQQKDIYPAVIQPISKKDTCASETQLISIDTQANACNPEESGSCGDSDEWEDCTDTSDIHDEDDDNKVQANVKASDPKHGSTKNGLQLDCSLNAEAANFLSHSPDFMKTPPGHVKVLNWAADCSTSPTSPGSVSSPQILSSASLSTSTS